MYHPKDYQTKRALKKCFTDLNCVLVVLRQFISQFSNIRQVFINSYLNLAYIITQINRLY